MYFNYDQFINEALQSEMKVGDYVQFGVNLKKYPIEGQFAKILGSHPSENDPNKTVYELEIDWEGAKKIILMSKIDNLKPIPANKYEYIQSGRLVKPKLTDACKFILTGMLNYDTALNDYMDITYIDIDHEKDDIISFIPSLKSKNIPENNIYTSPIRQTMRIGRFLRKIMLDDSHNAEIEKLVDIYKARWNRFKNFKEGIIIVYGEDIRYWYLQDRYAEGDGSLNNSCMRYEESQKRFDIYCENPDKVGMLIITSENPSTNKIELVARALLWNIDDPKITYLDRVYSTERKYEILMLDKAREMNWHQFENRDDRMIPMKVYVKRDYGDCDENPYMDTFRYFFINDGNCYLINYCEEEDSDYTYDDND